MAVVVAIGPAGGKVSFFDGFPWYISLKMYGIGALLNIMMHGVIALAIKVPHSLSLFKQWCDRQVDAWKSRKSENRIAYARTSKAIMARCTAGIERAHRIMISANSNTMAFMEATSNLMTFQEKILALRDRIVQAMAEAGSDSIERTQAEIDTLFGTKLASLGMPIIDALKRERADLIEIKERIESAIEVITLVCENLWIPAAGAHVHAEQDFMLDLQQQLTRFSSAITQSKGSELLRQLETGEFTSTIQAMLNPIANSAPIPPTPRREATLKTS